MTMVAETEHIINNPDITIEKQMRLPAPNIGHTVWLSDAIYVIEKYPDSIDQQAKIEQ